SVLAAEFASLASSWQPVASNKLVSTSRRGEIRAQRVRSVRMATPLPASAAKQVPGVPLRKLAHPFYEKPAIELARLLLGKILVRKINGVLRRARIVETEAYCGVKDLASHSSKVRTARTEVMFGPAGRAYVYFIYGMHEMFNIVGGHIGDAQAVLVRAAEPLDDWQADLTGPGKLAKAFNITRKDNGKDLSANDL